MLLLRRSSCLNGFRAIATAVTQEEQKMSIFSPVSRRLVLGVAFALATIGSAAAIEAKAVNNVEGVALKGFDPVAYFVDSKPRKGDPGITAKYHGVTYEFVNAEHKALFEKDPAKYAPEYNGYCAFGVTEGLKIDVDPHAYAINHGKLNVFFSDEARDAFQSKVEENIEDAHKKWPAVQKLTKVIR